MALIAFSRTPTYDRKCKGFGFDLKFAEDPGANLLDYLRYCGGRPVLIHHKQNWNLSAIPPTEADKVSVYLDFEPAGEDFLTLLKWIAQRGYKIALSEALFEKYSLTLEGLCRMVGIDPNNRIDTRVQQHVQHCKRFGVRVIGLNVGTYLDFNRCNAFGFDYYQGEFFLKPAVTGQNSIPTSRTVLLNLMTRMQDPHITMEEVEQLIAQDPVLTYKILRIVNSASEGLTEPIETLRPAILYIGLNKIAALVSIMAVRQSSTKPKELINAALLRAKMCELLAKSMGTDSPDRLFTAGLLSVLDAIFDVPLEYLIHQIPLSKEMSEGLLDPTHPSNPISRVLQNVYSYERGAFELIEDANILRQATSAYVAALAWADEAMLSD